MFKIYEKEASTLLLGKRFLGNNFLLKGGMNITSITIDGLRKYFPVDPVPSRSGLTDSMALDAYTEVSEYENKRWDALDLKFISKTCDCFYWFSESAFHYYFPAYLWHTYNSYKDLDMLAMRIVSALAPSENREISDRMMKRWMRFTNEQLEYVEFWVSWLRKSHFMDFPSSELEIAIKVLKERAWVHW